MAEQQPIRVSVQIAGEDVPAGRLWTHRHGRSESATFSYLPEYLRRPDGYELDPALGDFEGQQQTAVGQALFGAFSDCAPDSWGRALVLRAEQHRAREEERAPRSLSELDFLLGVRDDLRQGALRFQGTGHDEYLSPEVHGVPHLVDLPRLLHAAEELERDEPSAEDLRLLLHGSSSLGGARPKAHALDAKGRISIAKFPSYERDAWDVIRWEAVALELARRAGLSVPAHELHTIAKRPVLVVRRFDRQGDRRVGYASAMTLLSARDGDRGSYLEIAEAIEERSARAAEDLRELWRRIVFTVLISNTDDHLRNHGFLRTSSAGWTLSPAFDLNPNPEGDTKLLATAIDERSAVASIDTALQVADCFRLSRQEALGVVSEVLDGTERWREQAAWAGLTHAAIELMAPAFEHAERELAKRLVRHLPTSPAGYP
ncbi:MAG TPA: HipA domain-containing protein [Solirubrobacteraceae bacterium]|jgi:serine/threonine-protein kinase HipA|nr:HipA domain-containing protein [Solirubrobacteraceae bacterium]